MTKQKQKQIVHRLCLNSILSPCVMLFSPLISTWERCAIIISSANIGGQVNSGKNKLLGNKKVKGRSIVYMNFFFKKGGRARKKLNISHSAMEIKILRLEWVFISWGISINLGQKTQGKPVDLETAKKSARDYRAFGRPGLRPSHVWAVFFCSPSFLNFVLCLILQGALSFWWQLSNLVNKFTMTD